MTSKIIVFESTLQCTHDCLYCYNAWKNRDNLLPKELDTQSTVDMLNKAIHEMQPSRFVFSGGEPFLRSDIRELIAFVHSKKVPISIISNGALLEDEDFTFCKKHGVDIFEFTLLSNDKEIHNKLARPKSDFSAFDNVIWATQKTIEHKFEVIHVFVATHQNIGTISDTLKLSYDLGVRRFLFNRFNAAGEGSKHLNELQVSPLEIASGLKKANDFVIQHPTFQISCAVNIHPCLVDLKQFSRIKMTGCGVGNDQTVYVIDPVGNIRLCNFSSINVGNILTDSFRDIITSQKTKDFINSYPEHCKGCSKLETCQGGCKASADNCFGSPCQEDDWLRKYKTQIL